MSTLVLEKPKAVRKTSLQGDGITFNAYLIRTRHGNKTNLYRSDFGYFVTHKLVVQGKPVSYLDVVGKYKGGTFNTGSFSAVLDFGREVGVVEECPNSHYRITDVVALKNAWNDRCETMKFA